MKHIYFFLLLTALACNNSDQNSTTKVQATNEIIKPRIEIVKDSVLTYLSKNYSDIHNLEVKKWGDLIDKDTLYYSSIIEGLQSSMYPESLLQFDTKGEYKKTNLMVQATIDSLINKSKTNQISSITVGYTYKDRYNDVKTDENQFWLDSTNLVLRARK
jgi:hypothetical protein